MEGLHCLDYLLWDFEEGRIPTLLMNFKFAFEIGVSVVHAGRRIDEM